MQKNNNMELKFKQFIKEKGINENNLPVAIRNMITTVTNMHKGRLMHKNNPNFNPEKLKSDFAEVDNSLIELLGAYLENPELNFEELMKEDDFEETFEEVKEQINEIKEEAPIVAPIVMQYPTVEPVVVVAPEVKKEEPIHTKKSKEDILGQLYTAGQTKVKAEVLKGAGYPMGFFDDIYSNTGKYKLKKSLSGLYEISLK